MHLPSTTLSVSGRMTVNSVPRSRCTLSKLSSCRAQAVVAGAAGAATALVQVIYLDDGSIADGIPLERVFVDVETDHTGVVDAGDARAHAAARDAQSGLANLAQAAQLPTAAAARAFLGA